MNTWPVLTSYDRDHLARIAMPLGGIGTGQVSLGGRGDLRDWEIMNQPAKHYRPRIAGGAAPFFAIRTQAGRAKPQLRALEGPLEDFEIEGATGSRAANHGLPRFRECRFEAAYPFGQVHLSDRSMPVAVTLQAFNPLIPGDAEHSGLPVAILRYRVTNQTDHSLRVSLCGSMPNFIGKDGSTPLEGATGNRNRRKQAGPIQGIFMDSLGVDTAHPAWGTMAFVTTAKSGVSCRTSWANKKWNGNLLDFWDDFAADGQLDPRPNVGLDTPGASIATSFRLAARATREVCFIIAWHFPNRQTWTPAGNADDTIGNYYTTRWKDAWQVARHVAQNLKSLESDSLAFVNTFCGSDLPHVVKEAALFNLAVLRSQTCFRTPDGRFYGWEGCHDHKGSCFGSCTHVWNYEQALAFLFGELSHSMREIEFAHATDDEGCMSFRVKLPLAHAQDFGKAAADGQMGCIMKLYRDWQLSGNENMLAQLWPHAKRALEFCWLPGSWDADQDGVMEGCQHNTMDVEYYGPNPQMGTWYLGALRAAEAIARHLGDESFAAHCQSLFNSGSKWIDTQLFNGEFYEHIVKPPTSKAAIHPSLRSGIGSKTLSDPDFQLGPGCLVDQLVGQYMAHICGLGYLLEPAHIRKTLRSIHRYNCQAGFHDHFNNMRSFALKDETALLMASYPGERPAVPFPYFTEVMTGFEYTAAITMLQEGLTNMGLSCINNIRARYDGRRRNPFDEAECGRFYARAMASWGAVIALTGFHYSAVDQTLRFADQPGTHWWSTGTAWGECRITARGKARSVSVTVKHGELAFATISLTGFGELHNCGARLRAGPRSKASWQQRLTAT